MAAVASATWSSHCGTVALFGAAVTMMSLQPLLIHLAAARSGSDAEALPSSADTFMLLVEALKMVLCTATLLGRRAVGLEAKAWAGFRHSTAFMVPAAIYLIMNVFKVVAARAISPPLFQLLASTKIICTAVASWALLSRSLTSLQWVALFLLTIGVALGQFGSQSDSESATDGASELLPLVLMLTNSCLSAFGAVYTERVVKARQSEAMTTFATNLHMAAHTLLLNGTRAFLASSQMPRLWRLGPYTWAALLNEAMNGIMVSALMRHADSIVKNYAFGVSIFTTAGLSMPLLNFSPRASFLVGALLVLVSMYLYGRGTAHAARVAVPPPAAGDVTKPKLA